MIITYWNIGERFTQTKSGYITELLSDSKPHLFCIAEGSYSQKECKELEALISSFGYTTIYSPRIGKEKDFGFGYKRTGLKIFKSANTKCNEVEFEHQRNDGRIIRITCLINEINHSIYFIHNRSKSGNREVTDEQRLFINDLNLFINLSVAKDSSRSLVIGDFNLEPWDNILRTKGYFESNFISSHYSLGKKFSKGQPIYFNPVTETIVNHKDEYLGGTFYSKNYGWALYDYVIYDREKIKLDFEILTTTGESELLKSEITSKKEVMNKEIDHLPIRIKILE